MNYLTNNYLSHHGILGQKWGIRRFQNTDGSLTAAGRSRYGLPLFGKKKAEAAAPKEPPKQLTAEERATRKAEALRSGDIKKVWDAKDDMSNQELRDAIARIDLNKQLSDIKNSQEVQEGRKKIENVLHYADVTIRTVETMSKYYDRYQALNKKYNPKFKRDLQEEKVNNVDVEYIFSHISDFTNDELNTVANRITKKDTLRKAVLDLYPDYDGSDGSGRSEKKRKEALKKGDKKYVYSHPEDYSNKELKEFKERLGYLDAINGNSSKSNKNDKKPNDGGQQQKPKQEQKPSFQLPRDTQNLNILLKKKKARK